MGLEPDDDFDRGRTATAERLRTLLPGAPAGVLEGALSNPALTPRHLALALKSPAAGAAFIRKVAKNPGWMKVYEVKAAVVLHPQAPRPLAMNLVAHLWWRDLVRVSDRSALAPPLRRAAERLLATRMQELALGERIALARIAGRGIIGALRRDQSPLVARALLQNARLLEEDVQAIVTSPSTPGEVLRAVAEEPRWSNRPAIQKAVARHPGTPRAVALRFVQVLSTAALRELAASPKVAPLVKVAVERLLEARSQQKARDGSRNHLSG